MLRFTCLVLAPPPPPRWMAPEVIEHKPYDTKADVFSFAIVLWELLTCKVPYSDMTPLQVRWLVGWVCGGELLACRGT